MRKFMTVVLILTLFVTAVVSTLFVIAGIMTGFTVTSVIAMSGGAINLAVIGAILSGVILPNYNPILCWWRWLRQQDRIEELEEEMRRAEAHQKWFWCEAKVRAFLMSENRLAKLRQAGHLDRQYWAIQDGIKAIYEIEEHEVSNELNLWWEEITDNDFN